MMLATLRSLREIGGSATLSELDDHVIEREGVTEAEQSLTMPNDQRPKANYYLAWARTYLKRRGALANSSRGVWALTEAGEGINTLADCKRIYDEVLAEERERARLKRVGRPAPPSSQPESEAQRLDEEDSSPVGWQQELLSVLGDMASDAFERLAQRLLREAGFTKVEVRGKTGDGGIDGVGVLRVNLVSFQVYFQCKKWKGSVGAREIRDFRGALQGRADKGLFITTGNYTAQASEEATRDGAIAIDLIDGQRLCELLKQFDLGVETRMVEQITVRQDWFKEQ
jgi:restriction system protein